MASTLSNPTAKQQTTKTKSGYPRNELFSRVSSIVVAMAASSGWLPSPMQSRGDLSWYPPFSDGGLLAANERREDAARGESSADRERPAKRRGERCLESVQLIR